MLTGEGQLRGQGESGLLLVASEEAGTGRSPSGKGLRVKGKRAGRRAARGRRGRPKERPRRARASSRRFPERVFSSPTRSPSQGRPSPGDDSESSCFRQAGDGGGKGIPGSGGQACGGRLYERDTTPRLLPPSQRQTLPSLPLASFIPQLPGRLVSASANRYRPPHVLLLAASQPSPTP